MLSHILAGIIGQKDKELQSTVEEAILRAVGPDYPWPGNVRELAQAVRRVLLTGRYAGGLGTKPTNERDRLLAAIQNQSLNAEQLVAGYCALLYAKSRNYEDVARRTNLDRRTVKKHVKSHQKLAGV